MRVLVAGPRDASEEMLVSVRNFVMRLDWDDILIVGAAAGVDRYAELVAREQRSQPLEIWVMPAQWNRHGKKAGAIRTARMVDMAETVACFWDGKARGTKMTIQMAFNMTRPTLVYHADGTPFTKDELQERGFELPRYRFVWWGDGHFVYDSTRSEDEHGYIGKDTQVNLVELMEDAGVAEVRSPDPEDAALYEPHTAFDLPDAESNEE